jgi:hypothetical protein
MPEASSPTPWRLIRCPLPNGGCGASDRWQARVNPAATVLALDCACGYHMPFPLAIHDDPESPPEEPGYMPTHAITPNPDNPNRLSEQTWQRLKASIPTEEEAPDA